MRALFAAAILMAGALACRAGVSVTCQRSDPTISPRGFGSVSFAVSNSSPEDAEYQVEATVTPPLRLTGAAQRVIKVAAGATEVAVYNIYAPHGTSAGGSVRVTATETASGASSSASCSFAVLPAPAFESKVLSPAGDPIALVSSTGDAEARFELVLSNKGNVPLQLAIEKVCTPASAQLSGCPASLTLLPAETRKIPLDFRNIGATTFSEAVAHLIVKATHDGQELEATHHFVRMENYPSNRPVTQRELYKELAVTAGIAGGFSGSSPLLLHTLVLNGEIAPEVFLSFDGQLSTLSDRTAFIPGYEARSQFHLELRARTWLVEAGEVRRSFGRLVAPGERGAGLNAEFKLDPSLTAAVYAAKNSVTYSDKKTGGASLAWTPAADHKLLLNVVTVRDDPNPQTRNWTAAGMDWIYQPSKSFTFAAESAYGASDHGEGGALGANLLWRPETPPIPFELSLEGGAGSENFPGDQRGRVDGRIALEVRPMADLRLNALFYRSEYRVRPFFEETIEELKSLTPQFQRRIASEATSISATLERPMPITLAYTESVSFQKITVEEKSQERALSLTVSRPGPKFFGSVTARGGEEERLGHDEMTSRFASLSFDASVPISTSRGELAFNAAARATYNFEGDPAAVNRTGVWANVGASYVSRDHRVGGSFNVDAYRYASSESAVRARAGIFYRLGTQHEIALEGAYTMHRFSHVGRDEVAVLFSFKRSFGAPMPWMPHRGSMQGVVFNDLNSNGRQDAGEAGLPGVRVAVGKEKTLTDEKGAFQCPAMAPGAAPLAITQPDGTPLAFTTPPPPEIAVRAGKIGELAMGVALPLRVDGEVEMAKRSELLEPEQANGSIGIVAMKQAAGVASRAGDLGIRQFRSFTRGDGTFSIFLEPGTYIIRPESLGAGQTATPAEITLTVAAGSPKPAPRFVVNDRPREIKRKVFRQASAN